VGSSVGLVSAAQDGPAKPLVDSLIIFADEVEQSPDLGDGQPDQAAALACGLLLFAMRVWVICAVRPVGLSTGGGSPF
jgi:hypothetical protein